MGNNSLTIKFILSVLIFLISILINSTNGAIMQDEKRLSPSIVAQNYIEDFKKGISFKSPSKGIVVNERPDTGALDVIKKYLITENPEVREKIVLLLEDIGLKSDTIYHNELLIINDHLVIDILAKEGLIRSDLGGLKAILVLCNRVLEKDLTRYEDLFVQALINKPNEDLFLLIAKAKCLKAKPFLDELAQNPKWEESQELKIALAALGDSFIEEAFIEKLRLAKESKDVDQYAKALRPLSLIGTKRTLEVLALELRTPLIKFIPNSFKKSLRLNVLDAIRYNYPNERSFYSNFIMRDLDYLNAEEVCVKKFGINYTDDRPEFLTSMPYIEPANK